MVTIDYLLTLIDRYAKAVSERDTAYSEAAPWYHAGCAAAAASAREDVATMLARLADHEGVQA